eukprot:COSAG02_NODE_30975_length_541_cov_1.502262_1_plen_130_part_10
MRNFLRVLEYHTVPQSDTVLYKCTSCGIRIDSSLDPNSDRTRVVRQRLIKRIMQDLRMLSQSVARACRGRDHAREFVDRRSHRLEYRGTVPNRPNANSLNSTTGGIGNAARPPPATERTAERVARFVAGE